MPPEARAIALGRFFRGGPLPVARAVLIDTEPRVVRAALQAHPTSLAPAAAVGAAAAEALPAASDSADAAAEAPACEQRTASKPGPSAGRIKSILSRADAALDLALRGPRAGGGEGRGAAVPAAGRRAPAATRGSRSSVRSGAPGTRARDGTSGGMGRSRPGRSAQPPAGRGRGRGDARPAQAPAGRPQARLSGRTVGSGGGGRAGSASRGARPLAAAPCPRSAVQAPAPSARLQASRPPRSSAGSLGQGLSVRTALAGRPCERPAAARWAYSPGSALVRPGGAGNNWAIGYACLGPGIVDQAVRLVRAELRAVERLASASAAAQESASAPAGPAAGGIVLLQSLAGGTGSGVGAAVAEALRAAFPDTPLLAVAVGSEGHGAGGGAVCVGHMNTALSLDSLLSACDGVVLASNDDLASTAATALRDKAPSLETLNSVLADRIVALLLPATALAREPTPEGGAGSGRFSAPLRPQRRAAPLVHPLQELGLWPRCRRTLGRHAKLLTLALCPTVRADEATVTTCSWRAALRRVRAAMLVGASSDTDQMCRAAPAVPSGLDWAALPDLALAAAGGTKDIRQASAEAELARSMISRWHSAWDATDAERPPACIAAVVVCRGAAGSELLAQVSPLLRLLEHASVVSPSLAAEGGSSPACLAALASPAPFMGLSASVAALFSSARSAESIRRTVRRAASLVKAGAYLHHFCDRGVPEARLLSALSALWRDAENFHCRGSRTPV